MNRSFYFNYIQHKLVIFAAEIKVRGHLNILDFNIHAENFYMGLLNLIYNWNLKNINAIHQNVEAIDLVDIGRKILIQVSATSTKQKIDNALSKKSCKGYPTFNFKFISIVNDANDLRGKTYTNPFNLKFNSSTDIIDIASILRDILAADIKQQKLIYELIRNELGELIDIVKLDTNLASIINILAKEDLSVISNFGKDKSFEIERKIEFNKIDNVKPIIDDFKIYHTRLDKKYQEFDKQGVNKSISILNKMRTTYIDTCNKFKDNSADDIFFLVKDKITEYVLTSPNFENIPVEELDLCVNIILVDAFIRCKIFKNPEVIKSATT